LQARKVRTKPAAFPVQDRSQTQVIRKLASLAITAATIVAATAMASQPAAMASSAPAKAAPTATHATFEVVLRHGGVGPIADAACNSSNWDVALLGDSYYIYICGQGTITGIKQYGPYFGLDTVVTNRIWLHENPDNSGWADCFESPNYSSWTLTGTRDASPGNLQVAANTAAC
jgi:hypothetical protein